MNHHPPLPISIYAHVPYCASICPYCDFNSYVQPKPPWEQFTRALRTEMRVRASAYQSRMQLDGMEAGGVEVRSVYFGGGTPSLAPASLFSDVLATVRDCFAVHPQAEVTIEVNPGSVTPQQIEGFLQAGINRISLGWQSTHDRLLRVLGRGHSAKDSMRAFAAVRDAGCTNVSADLIFAVPGQTMADLDADLDTLIGLNPEHISLYALTYHEGTPLHRWRATGRVQPATEEIEWAMMQHINTRLPQAAFAQYEISNYSKPGKRAVHNMGYWTGVPYLGMGPGAHGFVHHQWQEGWRWEVLRDPQAYVHFWQQANDDPQQLHGMMSQPIPTEPGDTTQGVEWAEHVTARQMLGERMLCGLRMMEGVRKDIWTTPAFAPFHQEMQHAAQRACDLEWATQTDLRLIPTALGLQHADSLGALFV